MAFPLTHLCVAWRILEIFPMSEKEQFMLGSIAPDAIHYRAEYKGAAMGNIGPAKKVTHLCPVSEEKWGQVTDNKGWIECVRVFLRKNPGSALHMGYAAHVLTDIHNNSTIWNRFRTNHPQEAAKGYKSEYYEDMRNVDTNLYQDFPAVAQIMELLSKSNAADISGLVSAEEVYAIAQNIQHEQYVNTPKTRPHTAAPYVYKFVSYKDTLEFLQSAAEFCVKILQTT